MALVRNGRQKVALPTVAIVKLVALSGQKASDNYYAKKA
jgi:hypothetical protein